MSTVAAVQPFDARRARGVSPAARRVVDAWLKDVAIRLSEAFSEFSIDARLTYQSLFTQDSRLGLSALPERDTGCLITVGETGRSSVLSFRSGVMLYIVQGLLGVKNKEWPAERPLTQVELSLGKLLFERFAVGFSEAWPSREVLKTSFVQPVVRTARTRFFDPTMMIAVARFQLATPVGEDTVHWVITQDHLEELCQFALPSAGLPTQPSHRMADLAPLVPVPLSVELGRVQLSLSEAESLRCGDVLVLDKIIGSLLTGRVAGQPKFQGRPGRVGGRLCFEINSVVEE